MKYNHARQGNGLSTHQLIAVCMFAFMLNGCSSLFHTDYAENKNDGLGPSRFLSDVEKHHSTDTYDRIDVAPLSSSVVNKNIAVSTQTLPSEQPTRVSLEPQTQTQTQTQKQKPETHASLELPKRSAPPVASSRSNLTGKWAIQEAGNAKCKVVLSSSPALDLYKASTNGCSGADIRTVNSWDFRNGEVYLYSRGNVVARFKGNAPSLQGSLSKSGAPLVLSR